jgi:tRNA G18 (ribose-2'-O)-methylase SpoU
VPIVHVTSAADSRLDDYRNIPDAELIRTRGLFVAEGRLVVRRLAERSRFVPKSLLLTPAALGDLNDVIAHVSAPVFVVTQETMNEVAGLNFHRGCLAVGLRPPPPAWQDIVKDAHLVIVVERITNADNMGSIFRNAAAFGAQAVLFDSLSVDPLYRKAIRTSMGAVLQLPFAAMTAWPEDLEKLRKMGFTTIALTPAEDALPIGEAFMNRGPRAALLVGHEGAGLSDHAFHHADVRARIPMPGGIDSLNVATAAAIALYELRRSG